MKYVIKNGRVLDPHSNLDARRDVLIDDGKIQGLGSAADMPQTGVEVLDAEGKVVLPGLVDVHVHFREPGEEYKEDITSGALAAVHGGFSTVVPMPNTDPPIDNAEMVAYVLRRGQEAGLCRVLPSGGITQGLRGEALAPYGEMRRAGAVALTDDGYAVQDARLMRHALEYSRDFDIPVLIHAECNALSRNGHMHEGTVATHLGIPGIPRVAEDTIIARDIMLAEYVGGWLHVCHLSTKAGVALVREAKAKGLRVSAEVAPHHFTLNHHAVEGFDTNAKMYPPLREDTDRAALVEGLQDGTIDAVATDHAPHSSIEKDVAFAEAARGVIGLQTALPLTLDLWRQGHLTLMQVVERMTLGPCRALGLPYGTLREGAPADVTVVDLDATWKVEPDTLASRSKNTPFLGSMLRGRVDTTIVAGRPVFRRAGVTSP